MEKWAGDVIEDVGLELCGETGRGVIQNTHVYYNSLVHFVKGIISGLVLVG
jgi:hypothetical protein